MKSIEKLCELINQSREEYVRGSVSYIPAFEDIAAEIEHEIAERYMKLPLDADGVPIHIMDNLKFTFESNSKEFIVAFVSDEVVASATDCFYVANACHHINPDPVKELLKEFAGCGILTNDDKVLFEADLIEQYAERIRQALS